MVAYFTCSCNYRTEHAQKVSFHTDSQNSIPMSSWRYAAQISVSEAGEDRELEMAVDAPVRINVFRNGEELSGKAGKGKVSVGSSDKPRFSLRLPQLDNMSEEWRQIHACFSLAGHGGWVEPRRHSTAGQCQIWRRSCGA